MLLLFIVGITVFSLTYFLSTIRINTEGNSVGFYFSFVAVIALLVMWYAGVSEGYGYLSQTIFAAITLPHLIRLFVLSERRL